MNVASAVALRAHSRRGTLDTPGHRTNAGVLALAQPSCSAFVGRVATQPFESRQR